jgi:hypothetical protein
MFLLRAAALKRVGKSVPIGRLLLAADVARVAAQKVAALEPAERRRLAELLKTSATKPRAMGEKERKELVGLFAKLEPRALAATAVQRLSPVPIPGRLLHGRKRGRAKQAERDTA